MGKLHFIGLLLITVYGSTFGQTSFNSTGGSPDSYSFSGTINYTKGPNPWGSNCQVSWSIPYDLQLNGTWYQATAGMDCGSGSQSNFINSAYPPMQNTTWNGTFQDIPCSATCNLKINFVGPGGNFVSNIASISLSAPLPVDLVRFQAQKTKDNAISLNWATATERDNAGFEIERSTDGGEWEIIGFVEGVGYSDDENQYVFYDEEPVAGINYYRLRQIDQSGGDRYSSIAFAELNTKSVFSAYPNPVSSSLQFTGLNESTEVFITDILGNVVMKVNTSEDMPISVDHLNAGHYVAMVISENTQSQVRFQKL